MAQEKMTTQTSKPVVAKTVSPSVAPKKEEGQKVNKPAAAPVQKTAEKKAPAKKVVAKKSAPKKKTLAKKPTAKKVTAKKVVSKKTVTKKKSAVKKKVVAKKASASSAKKTSTTNTRNIGTNNSTMEKIMAQGKVNFEKLTQDATEMGRENVEAMIKSSTIFAKGFEEMMRTAMSFAQNSAEKQSKYVKEVLGSKTLHEFTETQNKIAQASFDDFMSNATKLTEMSVKTLNESIEPLNSQLSKGMQKATKMAA